ncbi:39172_t:CDS:1, partial [Gigaspora margarita]
KKTYLSNGIDITRLKILKAWAKSSISQLMPFIFEVSVLL